LVIRALAELCPAGGRPALGCLPLTDGGEVAGVGIINADLEEVNAIADGQRRAAGVRR
jgi:hypothetical protein